MGTYYYAAAALPMLNFSEKTPLTGDAFLSFCREQLTEKDYAVLEASRLDMQSGEGRVTPVHENQILRKWYTWEISLRNQVVRHRAAQLQKDAGEYSIESEEIIGMEDTVKHAVDGEDPLEKEKRLYEARWRYLEELGTNIFFTLESLIVYYMKLQLLEKLEQFDRERGEEKFSAIYTQITESADRDENSKIESNSGVNP